MKDTKFNWKGYWSPTPRKLRKWGDSLLAASIAASTYSVVVECKGLAISFMLVGLIGKIISNLFTEE